MKNKSSLRDHVMKVIKKTYEEKVQLAKKDLVDSLSEVDYNKVYERKLISFMLNMY